MSEYKIEKNIKMPTKRSRARKYPFPDMEVGDSFKIQYAIRQNVSASAKVWGEQQEPVRKFSQRKIDNKTVRVWRIS